MASAPKKDRLEPEAAIVVISRSRSYCNMCGLDVVDQGANRKRHVDTAGLSGEAGAGCQARFVGKTTDQLHWGPVEVARVWKNLPFVWLYITPSANPRLRVEF